ncbi:sulfurtransferase [Fodinisporobacter ferrooxydans]|uniref:Sulfurtransferase n=1 Tax=Fodinisporobacter ferrooxydans TaxID=2901836 RepID=A0ABY4CTN6_9BACL|nr:sulfurtransferase [Alicyclobacillaceae bacterium MYW30-H2]
MHSNLVHVQWLHEHLQEENLRILDCRFVLGQPDVGEQSYRQGHIPGALYLHLERDLSAPKQIHGGRHPLPTPERFTEIMSAAGIDEHVTVVAYDDQGGAFASRLWWMLKYFGHSNVFLLDGGFSAWQNSEYPVAAEIPAMRPKSFTVRPQYDWVVNMEEVKQKLDCDDVALIDSREFKRYAGLEEHIDPVAGHIPGARNYFWKDSLNDNGYWKNAKEQRDRFQGIREDREVIVYCGSGVTACPNILALKEAGFTNVKLYPGSWSDWCSYPDNPVERE